MHVTHPFDRLESRKTRTDPLCLLCLPLPQGEQCSDVRHVLQAFEQGHEVLELVVGWVADPAFDGDCVVFGGKCQYSDFGSEREAGQNLPSWKMYDMGELSRIMTRLRSGSTCARSLMYAPFLNVQCCR